MTTVLPPSIGPAGAPPPPPAPTTATVIAQPASPPPAPPTPSPSSTTPTTPAPAPTPPAPTTSAPASPQAALAALAAGTTIEATVEAQIGRGLVQLATPDGPVQVRLALPVPVGADLLMTVTVPGPQTQLRVLSLDGQTLLPNGQPAPASPAAPAVGALAADWESAALAAPADDPGAPLPPAGLTATLLRPDAQSGLPSGTLLTVRILMIEPPLAAGLSEQAASLAAALAGDPGNGGPPAAGLPEAVQPGAAFGPASPTVAADQPASLAGPYEETAWSGGALPPQAAGAYGMTASDFALPDQPAAAGPAAADNPAAASPLNAADGAPSAPSGPSLPVSADPAFPRPEEMPEASFSPATALQPRTAAQFPAAAGMTGNPPESQAGSSEAAPHFIAVVAPNSLAGNPLLQSPLGLLALDGVIDAAPGSRLTLTLVGPPMPPLEPASPQPASAPGGAPTQSWPAWQGAIAALAAVDARAAAQMAKILPEIGPRFLNGLVTMTGLLQSGNLSTWLDDLLAPLEKSTRKSVQDALEQTLADLKSDVRLPSGGDWQSLIVPLSFEQGIERIRLVYRRPPRDEQESDARKEEGNRFLLDVDLSRLGALQLDGLVRRKAKSFDLIIRTRQALPVEIEQDIKTIFAKTLEGMGMSGSAQFQQAVHFIEPIPLSRRGAQGVMI